MFLHHHNIFEGESYCASCLQKLLENSAEGLGPDDRPVFDQNGDPIDDIVNGDGECDYVPICGLCRMVLPVRLTPEGIRFVLVAVASELKELVAGRWYDKTTSEQWNWFGETGYYRGQPSWMPVFDMLAYVPIEDLRGHDAFLVDTFLRATRRHGLDLRPTAAEVYEERIANLQTLLREANAKIANYEALMPWVRHAIPKTETPPATQRRRQIRKIVSTSFNPTEIHPCPPTARAKPRPSSTTAG